MALKFCPECGAKLITQKFCQECGSNLSQYLADEEDYEDEEDCEDEEDREDEEDCEDEEDSENTSDSIDNLIDSILNLDDDELEKALAYVEKCQDLLRSQGVDAMMDFMNNTNNE